MPVPNALARKGVRRAPATPRSLFSGRSFGPIGASTAFARGEEVFGEGEPADYLYQVMSGGVRTYNTLSDGRRQIASFYLPGDIFGLEARHVHNVSAEAITRSKLYAVKKAELMARAASDLAMTNLLLDLTTAELQRTQAPYPSAAQDRAGTRRRISSRHGRTRRVPERIRSAHVASGYRGLSWPHHRNGVAHADAA